MSGDELVTHEQVARWLPADVRFAIDPHEHDWIGLRTMESAFTTLRCKVPGCIATEERIDW